MSTSGAVVLDNKYAFAMDYDGYPADLLKIGLDIVNGIRDSTYSSAQEAAMAYADDFTMWEIEPYEAKDMEYSISVDTKTGNMTVEDMDGISPTFTLDELNAIPEHIFGSYISDIVEYIEETGKWKGMDWWRRTMLSQEVPQDYPGWLSRKKSVFMLPVYAILAISSYVISDKLITDSINKKADERAAAVRDYAINQVVNIYDMDVETATKLYDEHKEIESEVKKILLRKPLPLSEKSKGDRLNEAQETAVTMLTIILTQDVSTAGGYDILGTMSNNIRRKLCKI